jgi:UDP-N-acetylmuramyl pentapeptide phosphotransferase/UDP-N-acetylglucosamine-1-phosphate transferase
VLLDLVILFIVVLIIIKIFRRFIKAAEEEMPIPEGPELGKEEGLPPMGGLEEEPKGPGEGLGELPPLGKM